MQQNPPSSPRRDAGGSLELRLFGPIEVRIGDRPLPHLRSRKGLWLLALLSLRRGRNVDRDWIAGTLWPECDERHARINLRQSLHDLRAALGSESWRLASDAPRTLRLDIQTVSIDALEFDAHLEGGRPEALLSAVALYRGPLLEDCAEEWAVEGRMQREQAVLRALETLALEAARREEHAAAADWFRSALRIDPYREDLQRALMEALAAAGSPAAAMAAYREYRTTLGRELMGEPAEETAVLFRRLREESRRAAGQTAHLQRMARPQAPASSVFSHPNRTLPLPLTALIGRDEAVRHVVSLTARVRLITLTGTGGVGKTRLVIRIAEELAAEHPDGVVFVDLAPLENADLLPDTVRVACAAPEVKEETDPVEALCRFLEGRRTMLVLDNCERINRACGRLVQRLLARCENLRIMATSREVLAVPGETVWRVPSLAVPRAGSGKPIAATDIHSVAVYKEFAAVRLFAERARAAEATFEISRMNSVAVVKICGRLDGIPLAIELAAARVRGMPVEKIAECLNDRFRILLGRGGSQLGAPVPRHQTLRASIDWSYDLLTELEQMLLRRLAVFVGGWTLEAAEAVCSGGPVREWELLELLTGLVDKSLVNYQPEADRYNLLETIRQYLIDKLEEVRAEAGLPAKHLAYFQELAQSAERELASATQSEWMDRLETDHDNLRAALGFAVRTAGKDGDVEAGLRLAGAVWRFWDVRGYSREGRRWLSILLELDSSRASTRARDTARAKAIFGAADLAFHYGEIAESRALMEQCLELQRRNGDLAGVARALNGVGNAASMQGDFVAAASSYEQGLAISRELGDKRLIAAALNNLGNLAIDQKDLPAARLLHEENVRIRRELGDPRGIALGLNNLALVAKDEGDYPAAMELHAECLALHERLGNRRGVALTLSNMGNVVLLMGDAREAEPILTDSLRELWELGDKSSVASTFEALAAARGALGRAEEAALLWGVVARLREDLGAPPIPLEVDRYRECISDARAVAGDAAFAAAWEQGRAMETGAAVAVTVSKVRKRT